MHSGQQGYTLACAL